MKKFFRIVFNLFLLFLFFFCLELISYNILYGGLRYIDFEGGLKWDEKQPKFQLLHYSPVNILDFKVNYNHRYDDSIPYDKKKGSIILYGCSYTFGQGIALKDNPSSQLQRYTNKKVYNISALGNGPSDILKDLCYTSKQGPWKNEDVQDIIYIIMFHHVWRIVDTGLFCNYLTEKYTNNKEKSVKDKIKYLLNKSYIIRLINGKRLTKNDNVKFDYLKYIVLKCNHIISQRFPNAKFTVLLYDDINDSQSCSYDMMCGKSLMISKWNDIKEQGINVISTKELVGDILSKPEYQLSKDIFQTTTPHHPNEKAWEKIIPPLCKKLNL